MTKPKTTSSELINVLCKTRVLNVKLEVSITHYFCETSKCALKSNDGNTTNFFLFDSFTLCGLAYTHCSPFLRKHIYSLSSSVKSIMKRNILYVPTFIKLFLKTLHCPFKRWESRERSVRSPLSSCTFSVTKKHHLDRSLLSCSFSLLNRAPNKPGWVIHS